MLPVFYLRIAATNAHDFFTAAHETLQNVVITNTLGIDQIIADFAPSDSSSDNSVLTAILRIVGSGLSVGDKIVKQSSGRVGDLLGLVGGILGIAAGEAQLSAANAETIDLASIKTKVENQLANVFTATNQKLTAFNSKLFGGNDNIDLTQVAGIVSSATGNGVDGSLHPVTQIFSSGSFLAPAGQNELNSAITAGFQQIKQGIVGSVLASLGFFVRVDTNRSENDCNGITGARFINGQCFAIEKRTPNNIIGLDDSQPMDRDMVLKLDNPSSGYNFDMNAFYQNVQECNNGSPSDSLDIGSDLPRCAFGMAFIRAAGPVCNAVGTPNLAANLQINTQACNKVVCTQPIIGGGCNS
jgi:hypothetical protein